VKDEILAKKAKLAELKRQRELRQKEFSQSRQSIGDASDVCRSIWLLEALLTALDHPADIAHSRTRRVETRIEQIDI
jgi:hypothetical protein